MSQKPSVLVVDDESGILDTLRILLRNEGFEVTTAQGGKAGLEQIRSGAHDIILSDVRMPQVSGLDILQAAREQDAMTPVILMTAQASLQSAIGAVNSGAFYYIQKPFSNDELVAILRRACEYRAVKVENKQLKQEIRRKDKSGVSRPIGKSKRFLEVLKLAEHVAPTDSTVLIQGESGTGKEVVARYIHNLSMRADGPFLSINCGALPENLLESELFGHVKGSFTGAVRDKQGLFAAARGGTFFLDEVGEMPPSLQVKLLRVLQEREVIPVGATESIPVDVRIVAATNRELEEEIRRGNFRSDLFYRLNVFPIRVPPLRERRSDIPLLVAHFLAHFQRRLAKPLKGVTPESMEQLQRYSWPGNIRELQNVIERSCVLARGSVVDVTEALGPAHEQVAGADDTLGTLDDVDRMHIRRVLEATDGVISGPRGAAKILGLHPNTLRSRMERLGLIE